MNTENAQEAHVGVGDPPLGERLRRRRKELKLTLQTVADRSGFSVGFISQIERGITVPSLTSLIAVCRTLEVEVGTVFTPPKVASPVTRRAHRPIYALGDGDGNVSYERLSAAFPGNVLRSTIIHEPPGRRSEPMSHEGEEIYFILEGSLTLEIDGERIVLESGDSAHFPSTRIHATWNHTSKPTTILHTCTMDVFGDGEPSGDPDNSLAVTRAASRHGVAKKHKPR
ncbi:MULTISPECIES: cupin domain-containing protein [unclassified Sinorhizobium]|uniref:helix-turn-helix domain-containing protein n=1 Tax=unclassified Sinorhizobium TaxID=2613772 RepID=UPI0024C29F9C|nr:MULTISPECIES: cupin domain-containing protein [unclassified Sinorhizobium]MDK1378464.1 cupin domain-containing protein [Sinorhizobium sp. 6-70]MDK1481689.1 cupin domain-containing protein [Sinorhizobium sp. 6-117]